MKRLFAIFSVIFAMASLSGAVRTIEADVFPMADFAPPFRYQILAKGMDSWKNSWRLEYSQSFYRVKPRIVFHTNQGWGISAQKALPPFRNSRITAVFDGKKARLYLNGALIAEKAASQLPPDNTYQLWVGRYAKSKNLLFPGKVSNVKLSDKVQIPEKVSFGKESKQHFFYQLSPRNSSSFKRISGSWKYNNNGFGESTDKDHMPVFAQLPVEPPADFVFTTGIITRDNMGQIHWEFCRKDDQNTYLLTHKNIGVGVVFLTLYKKQNNKLFVLAETTSAVADLPGKGFPRKPIFVSIARKGDQIHVRVKDREVISVIDKTFTRGKVRFGLQGRKADFCRVTLTSYPEYCASMKPVVLKPVELKVKNKTLRQVFYRDEPLRFTAEFINRSPDKFLPAQTKITFDGKTQTWKTPAVPAGKSVQHTFTLDGSKLRAGTYKLALSSGKYKADFDVTLVDHLPKDHYVFTNSRHNIAVPHLKQVSAALLNGSGFTLSARTNLEHLRRAIAQANDYAMLNGMNMGLRLPMLRNTDAAFRHMRVVRKDGTRPALLDAWRPDVRKYFNKEIDRITTFFKDYPTFKFFNLESEIENFVEPSYSKESIARATKVLGFAPPMAENSAVELDNTPGRMIRIPEVIRKATPPVFSAKDKNYLYMRYFWEEGIGDNYQRAELLPIIRKHIPGAVMYHEPWRNVILSKRMIGHEYVGTWSYCHPDAGATFMAVEAMLAGCRAAGVPERFTTGPSLWLYNQRIGPARQTWAGAMPTDIFLLSLHLTFAAKPAFLEMYDLSFLLPGSRAQFKEADTKSEITRFIRTYARPLWSAMGKLDRDKPKSALLVAFATQVFSRSRWGGYGWEKANLVLDLLWKAQVPSSVVTEETILQGELERYDRLFLHQTSHMPDNVRDKIARFIKKGGKVYAESDSPWIKLIPGVTPLDIPLERIAKSSYYAVRRKKGYTADIVYADKIRNAETIRAAVAKESKKVINAVWSPSNEVYIRSLNKNDSRYIFVINDRRTFGDYFGKKYKAVYEAGLPQQVQVKVNVPGTVYLYPDGKKLALKNKTAELDMKRADCKVLIVYPDEVKNIKLASVPRFVPGKKAVFKIVITGKNGKPVSGVQPLRLRMTASDKKKTENYTSAVNGVLNWSIVPAKNDLKGRWQLEVCELASGMKKVFSFTR